MMDPVHRVDATGASACDGRVTLDATKIIWTGGLMVSGLILIPFFTNWTAAFIGLTLTYITLLLGHSVGMHRMMIHRSFETPPWLRYSLIYLGTLVGIGGPSGIIKIHDTRDWAQREPKCHDYFSHQRGFWRDITWQLFYRFDLDNPPKITIEPNIQTDPFLKHLDTYWRWHQIGLACLLFLSGGLPLVVWGICLRVTISTVGHWTVTYICHNPGPGRWAVEGSGVQASDLKLPNWIGGWLTHGECWHSNHHAFPESAQIGLERGQIDPAWYVIAALEKVGLAKDVGRPRENINDLRERGDYLLREIIGKTPAETGSVDA